MKSTLSTMPSTRASFGAAPFQKMLKGAKCVAIALISTFHGAVASGFVGIVLSARLSTHGQIDGPMFDLILETTTFIGAGFGLTFSTAAMLAKNRYAPQLGKRKPRQAKLEPNTIRLSSRPQFTGFKKASRAAPDVK